MALSMEGSIRQVELLFQKAVAELDEVQHALENEFAEKFPKNVDPLRLLNRVQKLQKEIPVVQEECQKMVSQKRSQLQGCEQLLLQSYNQLQSLMERAGLPTDRDMEEAGMVTSEPCAKSSLADLQKVKSVFEASLRENLSLLYTEEARKDGSSQNILTSDELAHKLIETEVFLGEGN